MAIAHDRDRNPSPGWQPRTPLDPCRRMTRFGPVQPMPRAKSLLHWLLFG